MRNINEIIFIIFGDITKISSDAIVNSANTSLLGGSGVDGAIHKAGGRQILDECKKIRNVQGGCKVGSAVITSAGNLSAKYIIHAVGPVWTNKNEDLYLLSKVYKSCLDFTLEFNIESISFPSISTGRYGFPKNLAAEVALNETIKFIRNNGHLKRVNFVCYDMDNYIIYSKLIKKHSLV